MSQTILQTLRSECGEIHEQLHRHQLLRPLSSDQININDYSFIIQAFYIAYKNSERAIALNIPAELPNAEVLKWLEIDLLSHNLVPAIIYVDFPVIDNLSKFVGYLYAKQGSTLGGQVISKHLNKYLDLKSGINNNFFYSYGPQTGANWKLFVNYIENSTSKIDQKEVIETAKLSFQNISNCCDLVLKTKNA